MCTMAETVQEGQTDLHTAKPTRLMYLVLGWFEPLREVIAREQQVQHIDLLPPDRMTLIVMHKMMGLVMVGNQDGCVQVVQSCCSYWDGH
ncbi:hypothetical protein ACFX14_013455 [Malus domestica]